MPLGGLGGGEVMVIPSSARSGALHIIFYYRFLFLFLPTYGLQSTLLNTLVSQSSRSLPRSQGPPGPNPIPVPTCPARPGARCPNIVFLIDESTDGRTYRPDGFAPTVELPSSNRD